MENFIFVFLLNRATFSRGWCNRTQCTPSVTLIFRRTVFSCHIQTSDLRKAEKIILLFPEIRVMKKYSPGRPQKNFFLSI